MKISKPNLQFPVTKPANKDVPSTGNFNNIKPALNFLRCVFCCLTIFVTIIQMTFAQPDTDAKKAATTAENQPVVEPVANKTTQDQLITTKPEAANLGEKNKAFMSQYENYANILKKLTKIKVEYVNAKPERAVEIDKEFKSLIDEGAKLCKTMLDSAIAAYNETPNRSIFVNNFLFSTLVWEFNRDNFEVTVKIFKAIADKKIPKDADVLYTYAGLAAIMTCDFAEAESWLKTAKENKSFEQYIEKLQSSAKGRSKMSHEQVKAMNFLTWSSQLTAIKADWEKEKAIRAAEAEANKDAKTKLPRVELNTSKGKIVIELFENEAPNSVANFISLVEKKFYSGSKFHRVLPCFMAQGGDNAQGGPGYKIDDECRKPEARKHFRGSLSMANAGPNTNDSQFFLTFVKTHHLDGRHTVFGRVVEGIEVLAEIQRIDPEDTETAVGTIDEIIDAKVLNKRDHAYEPIKNR
ncbi:MAG: peptidylprolyl isomerase [Planctomycetaceae bacterium]|jgi:cyclophilin family peptidyl-prolyl cis-trans isomerase|nr:peptidylprolyl isomerase [Planctomycetaceae bacterium]